MTRFIALLVLILAFAMLVTSSPLGANFVPDKFHRITVTIKLYGWLLAAFSSALFLFPKTARPVFASAAEFVADIKGYWRNVKSDEKLVAGFLFSFILAYRSVALVVLPVCYDEAWTFLHLSLDGVITSWSHYPAPNNHVLHSILTAFSVQLPFADLYGLRLPSFVIGILMTPAFYMLTRCVSGVAVSASLTLAFALSFFPFIYSIQGRGYGLILLCSIVVFTMTIQILRKPKIWHFGVFALVSAIGYASMPSFLYFHATVIVVLGCQLLLSRRFSDFINLVISNLVMSASVILFYLPIILNSGIEVITSNGYIVKQPRLEILKGLMAHQVDIYTNIFQTIWFLPLITAAGIWLLFKGIDKKVSWLAVLMLLFSIFIPVVHAVFAFVRTWIHLLIPAMVLLALAIEQTSYKNLRPKALAIVLVILFIPVHLLMMKQLESVERYSYEAKQAFEMMKGQSDKTIFVNTYFVRSNMEFYQYSCGSCIPKLRYGTFKRPTEAEIESWEDKLVVVDADVQLPSDKWTKTMNGMFVFVYERND